MISDFGFKFSKWKKKTDFKLGSTHIKLKVYIYIQNEKKKI